METAEFGTGPGIRGDRRTEATAAQALDQHLRVVVEAKQIRRAQQQRGA